MIEFEVPSPPMQTDLVDARTNFTPMGVVSGGLCSQLKDTLYWVTLPDTKSACMRVRHTSNNEARLGSQTVSGVRRTWGVQRRLLGKCNNSPTLTGTFDIIFSAIAFDAYEDTVRAGLNLQVLA